MSTVITVENLSKKYTISHQQREDHSSLRDALANSFSSFGKKLAAPFMRRSLAPCPLPLAPTSEDFWALKDVSFEVKQGERIGVIGRNGAGKSTLLKILSRITEPTTGSIRIKGRVASLLEVGTGFHPELTGRENIFLNGAILGMHREEIRRKFDEIVDFAEIEKFLDTPVKRYSSGMYVRLAFAVAAHLEPEILIVDEVLAVGDAQFQKKCLGKMENAGSEGRTILFVSHNMTALKSICNRAIWLNSGVSVEDGESCLVVSNYLQKEAVTYLEQVWSDVNSAPGNEKVRLQSVRLIPQSRNNRSEIDVTVPLKFEFVFWSFVPDVQLNFSMHLYNIEGMCVFNTASGVFKTTEQSIKGSCHIPGNFLNDGIYRVKIMIVQDTSISLFNQEDVLVFEVHDIERAGNWYGKWAGIVRPTFEWRVESLDEGVRP